MNEFPDVIDSEEKLDELLSRPGEDVINMFSNVDGDLIFLGIAGKIGLSLAQMAKRACDEAGVKKKIIGVSQFSSADQREKIEKAGIETIKGDLLDINFIRKLPKLRNVFFLAGMKFGSVDNLSLTWAVNSFMPAMVAEHFANSRIVTFSTGCVYPLVPVGSGGSLESDIPHPVGEYAQSCLGRERMFEYGSNRFKTPVSIIRLNYSVELRYGVLVDIATKVKNKLPVNLDMGYFNVIWQGDSNDVVLRSLELSRTPPKVLNITGPDTLSVREVALEFGQLMGTDVTFEGEEARTALLSNSREAYRLFSPPKVPISQVIKWTADWIARDGKTLGKPTRFEVRDGKY
ncbi:MAG: NAD-dependent epimerase/dehydratase family protein [Bacteroidales bacterium]